MIRNKKIETKTLNVMFFFSSCRTIYFVCLASKAKAFRLVDKVELKNYHKQGVKTGSSCTIIEHKNINKSYSYFLGISYQRWITYDLCRYALLYDQNLAINQISILPLPSKINLKEDKTKSFINKQPILINNYNTAKKLKNTGMSTKKKQNFVLASLFLASLNNVLVFKKPVATERRLLNVLTLQKIVLHSNSGQYLVDPSNSSNLDLAFSTISCQTPSKIYAIKNVSGFKLSKNALLGMKSTLRSINAYEFFYKWLFIAASELKSNSKIQVTFKKHQKNIKVKAIHQTISFALNNVFVFNELDSLDYTLFSNLRGFEISQLYI